MSGTQSPVGDCTQPLNSISRTPRRRFVLGYLLTRPAPVSLAELAAALFRWERRHRVPDQRTTPDEHRIGLRHVHLPALAEAGLVAMEREGDAVRLTADADSLGRTLTLPTSRETLRSIAAAVQAD